MWICEWWNNTVTQYLCCYIYQEVLRYVVSVGVCCVCLFVNMCWDRISRKRLEIETQLQWSTYSVSQKIPPPEIFWHFSPKRLGIFSPNFTCLLHIPIYTRLPIFIQLPATLTKLWHIKRGHHHALKMSTIGQNARWVVALNMA